MNLTLVAYYENKPREFVDLVNELQCRLESLLGDSFTPYELQQVHSTIIGLEGRRDGNRILNMNYLKLRKQRRYMDFAQLADAIDHVLKRLPLRFRIGGYRASDHYPFTSLGEHPFVRSFSIRNDIALAMGWPAYDKRFPQTLDRLRREFANANVLHKYHASTEDVDNDLFFASGRVDSASVEARCLATAQQEIRDLLALREPIHVELRQEHLSLVSYEHPTLPLSSSTAYPVKGVGNQVGKLQRLFATIDSE